MSSEVINSIGFEGVVAHATAAGDSFNATVFSGERPNKAGYLPPASVACMQIYLFDRSFRAP